jgi:hypothetical protein
MLKKQSMLTLGYLNSKGEKSLLILSQEQVALHAHIDSIIIETRIPQTIFGKEQIQPQSTTFDSNCRFSINLPAPIAGRDTARIVRV